MTIPTLVEPIPGGFRASTGGPLDLTADGSTAAAAVTAVSQLISRRLGAGASLLAVPITPQARPPLSDATWAKFRSAIDQYREEREAEELAHEAADAGRPTGGD